MKTKVTIYVSESALSEWWSKLTHKDKRDYLKEHPDSKFAPGAGKNKDPKAVEPEKEKTTPVIGVKKTLKQHIAHHAQKTHAKLKDLSAEQQKFFKGEDHVAGSAPRRAFGKFMKDKAKGLVKGLKHEVKEWKTGVSAIRKLSKGGKLDHHDKAALKAIAIHTALVLGPMAITGGLSLGLSHALPGLAIHLAEHSLALNIGRAVVFAGVHPEHMGDDALLESFISKMGEAMAEAKISKSKFINALALHNTKDDVPAEEEKGPKKIKVKVKVKPLTVVSSEVLHTPVLKIDNPGGSWEQTKQRYNTEDGVNAHGAPARFGPATGSWNRKVLIPLSILAGIKGMLGEQIKVRQPDLKWLSEHIAENKRLPLTDSGDHYCPFITVYHDGTPWVNEGNHRIMAAKKIGLEYLPIEIKYYAGGEKPNGLLAPAKVKAMDLEARKLGVTLTNYAEKGGAIMHDSLSASKPSGYTGSIKIPNEPAWEFKTIAPSLEKAKNNGLSQYSKFKNMNIAQLHRYMAQIGSAFSITVTPVLNPSSIR